jgi:branched-chain amino acid transport system substrate-binding protein
VLGTAVFVAPAIAQKKYDVGATDTEIKIGQTMPFSGPASAVSTIAKTEAAYFKMINDAGGINGRKITFIQYDDSFSPPKTVEQVRKLVEGDEVLLTFHMMGTAPSAAVQKYLNDKHVPQLFVASGVTRFIDPANYPWSMGFNISYTTEANIYAKYILSNYPNAKIGVLFQNDDLGREYVAGLKAGLGEMAEKMIVATASYETTDPTVDSQILKLRAAGPDLLYDITGPKAAGQTIKKLAEIGWKPVHLLDSSAATVWAVVQSAGLENSKGVTSVGYFKDPLDPTWKDDPGMKNFVSFMDKYYPEGDRTSGFQIQGYSAAQLMVEVLKRCGDDLTRENIMRQATNLQNIQLDLSLPGVLINTSPTDYRVNKQVQMIKFNGERWEPFGPIIGADGR